jgi:hypothetical protein
MKLSYIYFIKRCIDTIIMTGQLGFLNRINVLFDIRLAVDFQSQKMENSADLIVAWS